MKKMETINVVVDNRGGKPMIAAFHDPEKAHKYFLELIEGPHGYFTSEEEYDKAFKKGEEKPIYALSLEVN
jgi:hypothetical protein